MLNDVSQAVTSAKPPVATLSAAAARTWRPSFGARLLVGFFAAVNRVVPWYRLPTLIGVANLAAIRVSLRQHNLFHPTLDGQAAPSPTEAMPQSALARRTADGAFNDFRCPAMGGAMTRFGRNIPLSEAQAEAPELLMSPSPRLVSERLLARRDAFAPATGPNLLAAAWVQFQTHDWFDHGENDAGEPFEIPLDTADGWHERPMRIRRTGKDASRTDAERGLPPTFQSRETHWWDASAIYGSNAQKRASLDNPDGGGYLRLDARGRLLPVLKGETLPATGVNSNWWIGLEILHTLFALEHNAICDELRRTYPNLDRSRDHDHIQATARLINAALMAKIHTVEWTPAILSHPTLRKAMRANWWGLVGEPFGAVFGRRFGDTLSGIPGSETDHHGVPFTLTEEFVSVYRMHSLLPDSIDFWQFREGRKVGTLPMREVLAERSHLLMEGEAERVLGAPLDFADFLYSFGVNHPGALTLHNYPDFLRRLELPDGHVVDMAAIDVLRDRERGVPRYNRMRRLLRLKPACSFEEMTGNSEWARQLREVYGDVERVDLQVGMLAERLVPGFGFSETAFRIFILMASRRLKSDRFLTRDFTPRVYTPAGMRWISENDMTSVILRHCPELTPMLMRCDNAFQPWAPVGSST